MNFSSRNLIQTKIFLIIILALVLRLWNLGNEELWHDELLSITYASQSLFEQVNAIEYLKEIKGLDLTSFLSYFPFSELILSTIFFDPHPPVFYIQLHFWNHIDSSDFWLKLNSVFWSILTLIAIYYISTKLLTRQIALTAAVIFSVAPIAIFYSQEVRMYSMLMFLSLVLFYVFHKLIFNNSTSKNYKVLFTVLTLIYLYSHGSSFLIMFCLFSYFVINKKESLLSLKQVIVQFSIIFILYIPWLIRATRVNLEYTKTPNFEDIVSTLTLLFFGFVSAEFYLFTLVGTILLFIAMLYFGLRDKNINKLVVSFIIIPIVVCIIISYSIKPIWIIRSLAFIFPFTVISLASIIVKIHERYFASINKYLFTFVYFLIFLTIAMLSQSMNHSRTPGYKSAVEYIDNNIAVDEKIFFPANRTLWSWGWYAKEFKYLNPLTTKDIIQKGNIVVYNNAEQLLTVINKNDSIWLIYNIWERELLNKLEPYVTEKRVNYSRGLIVEKIIKM